MVSLCVILHSKIRNQIGKLFFPTRARPVRRHSGIFFCTGLCIKTEITLSVYLCPVIVIRLYKPGSGVKSSFNRNIFSAYPVRVNFFHLCGWNHDYAPKFSRFHNFG